MVPNMQVPLSKKQKLVLYCLTDNAARNGPGSEREVVMRRKQIMDATGLSERHVPYVLRKLESLGYITTIPQRRPDGSADANCYVVHDLDERRAEI
jgi:hypothetical protein